MAWQINQLSVDFQQNRAIVSLQDQGPPNTQNAYLTANVTFPVTDNDQRQEGATEAHLKQRAKEVLIAAANSL